MGIAGFLSGIFWIAIILVIFIISKKNKRAQLFKDKMISMWKYSLAIALVGYISAVISNYSCCISRPNYTYIWRK
ncbi:hypothetical protein LL033_25045 (plasmid) [Clostridium estertheticum]|uniref:hypothetical protein n=1 Tax=Clostridium estertheticum TaxID=238834 RepID=UPI001C0D7663|nr:hypothetical protein [Clostridium estertheticum]MBU3217873.1 hypothetical protein [Clostridium estertheticum]WAG58391.1 hypothetical protein LL033_25045 [Clostridium estertheticum]